MFFGLLVVDSDFSVTNTCSLLKGHFVSLGSELFVEPVNNLLGPNSFRVSDEPLVGHTGTADCLQMHLGDVTNVYDAHTACADLCLGPIKEVLNVIGRRGAALNKSRSHHEAGVHSDNLEALVFRQRFLIVPGCTFSESLALDITSKAFFAIWVAPA